MSTEALLPRIAPVFAALTSSDGANTTEATTEMMDLVRQWPGEMMLLLAQVGALGVGGFQLDTRLLATILFIRVTFSPLEGLHLNATDPRATSPFDYVGEAKRAAAERALCQGLVDEMDTKMRKGLGKCAASWAQESAKRQRPCIHMPPVLLQLTQSERPFHRFTPYQVLSQYPTLLVDSVSDSSFTSADLLQTLRAGLNDPSVDVKVEAMQAIKGAIRGGWTVIKQNSIKTRLILDAMTVMHGLSRDTLDSALEPLSELADDYPSLFLPIIDQIMPFLLSLIAPPRDGLPQHSSYSPYPLSDLSLDDWRLVANQAIEMMLSIMVNYPGEFEAQERQEYVRALVGSMLGYQISAFGEQMDCAEWKDPAANLSEEDYDYPLYPEEVLYRLAESIDRGTMLSALTQQTDLLLHYDDWRARYVALRGLASVIQASEPLYNECDRLYSTVKDFSKDSHIRVRYGWLQLMPVFVINLNGTFQSKYMIEVIKSCVDMLSEPLPRFRIATIEAIASMFRRDHAEHLVALTTDHIEEINARIIDTVGSMSDEQCEAMFHLFTNLAESMGKKCLGVHHFWMDNLLGVASFEGDGPNPSTRAAALETATIIGVALGKEAFVPYASDLSKLLLHTQNDIKDQDDPRVPTLIEAWYNMSKVLGADFAPFLPVVLPPILESASVGFESSEDKSGQDPVTYAASEEMESKALAMDSVALYSPLGEMFIPFLDRSMAIALDALRPTYPMCVIESAAALIPSLMYAAKNYNTLDPGSEDVNTVFSHLVDALVQNTEYTALSMLNKAFGDTIRIIAHSPSVRVSERYLDTALTEVRRCRSTKEQRNAERQHYTIDDERLADYLTDEEGDILREIQGALKAMNKYETDESIKKAISDVAKEVESVLAIPKHGGQGANGQERGGNGWFGGNRQPVG